MGCVPVLKPAIHSVVAPEESEILHAEFGIRTTPKTYA